MTKQTTLRLPDDVAQRAEAVARVRHVSFNQFVVEAIVGAIERAADDSDFRKLARQVLKEDQKLLERLART